MPDAAVVAAHIVDHPFDGVVGVGAFVDALGVVPIARRALHHELAFGLEAAADVLKGEDVAIGNQVRIAGQQRFLLVGSAVRSTLQQDRKRAAGLAWRKEDGVQLDAVAHGNHNLLFGKGVGKCGR